jgi:hypothetical protein
MPSCSYMAAGTQISVEEYLKTVYRCDRDYVDGVLEERNSGGMGPQQRSNAVRHLLFRHTGLCAVTELRMRVRENKYRVPDVVVTLGTPQEQCSQNRLALHRDPCVRRHRFADERASSRLSRFRSTRNLGGGSRRKSFVDLSPKRHGTSCGWCRETGRHIH